MLLMASASQAQRKDTTHTGRCQGPKTI